LRYLRRPIAHNEGYNVLSVSTTLFGYFVVCYDMVR